MRYGVIMKSLRCLIILLLFAFIPVANAEEIPSSSVLPSNPGVFYLDNANVLSNALKDEIQTANHLLDKACGAQFVVVTIDTTGNMSIDDYSYALFNKWGIGRAENNNGFLLLLAIDDDDYYAVPGDGLSEQFPVSQIVQFFDLYLENDFSEKNYDSGVRKFFEAGVKYIAQLYEVNLDFVDNTYRIKN